jgi:hypothetical protein
MECLVNRLVLQASVVVALLATVAARPSPAAEPSETLLPETTKGYLSIPDWGRLESDFNSTQLGELANDEIMRPFIEDLKRQIRQNGARRLEKLGITFEDLRGIVGGETALAMIQLDEQGAAQVALVDVTGHEAEARKLLDRMAENLTRQGGRRLRKATDSSVAIFELPRREGERQGRQTASFLKGSLLCIGSDMRAVEDILRATSVERKASLGTLPAFRQSMAHLDKARGESGKAPHIRWFIEPFGYAECVRMLEPPKEKPNPDVLRVLRKQEFTAIRGLSGHVTFAAERYELLHRTMIFAPPAAAGDSKSGEKYKLAARMLDFPNSENLRAETWVPRDLATYSTWNWSIQKAFDASKTLVDEWFGEPDEAIFQSVLDDMRDAKDGPRVDIEKDLVGNLADRVTLITDYETPVGPKSERWLAGVKTTDARAVAMALEKSLKNEPNVQRRQVSGFTVWEIAEQQQAHTEALVVEIPGGVVRHADIEVEEYEPVAFQPGKARAKQRTKRLQKQTQQQQRVIQNMALTVAYDHLFVASHVDMLARVLNQAGAEGAPSGADKAAATEHLGSAADYRRVVEEMQALGADSVAARFFSRSDEAFRINYELLRTNEMPKAQSIMGKLLNELLADGKPGTVRRARLDGSKLPPYDAVRRYLGPTGGFVVTEPDGWMVTGFMLDKEMMVRKAETE